MASDPIFGKNPNPISVNRRAQSAPTPGSYKAPVDSNNGNVPATKHVDNDYAKDLLKPWSNPGRKPELLK